MARLLSAWTGYVERLGRDAYFLLVILEAIRLRSPSSDTFNYRELENTLSISPATLRRWLRILKTAGLVSTQPVPGSNRSEAMFRIHLQLLTTARPGSPLSSERTPKLPTRRARKSSR